MYAVTDSYANEPVFLSSRSACIARNGRTRTFQKAGAFVLRAVVRAKGFGMNDQKTPIYVQDLYSFKTIARDCTITPGGWSSSALDA
jgi:hypothetical protein